MMMTRASSKMKNTFQYTALSNHWVRMNSIRYERCFSSVSHLLSDNPNNLSPESIEACNVNVIGYDIIGREGSGKVFTARSMANAATVITVIKPSVSNRHFR